MAVIEGTAGEGAKPFQSSPIFPIMPTDRTMPRGSLGIVDHPTGDISRRNLARLDVPSLIEGAEEALEQGEHEQAIRYLRTAVRKAPLRTDLREMLITAIESASESRRLRSESAPKPLPRPSREPLFEEDWPRREADSMAGIEQIDLDEEEQGEARPRTSTRRIRSSYGDRHRRGPVSATVLALSVAAFMITGVGAAVVWMIYEPGGGKEKALLRDRMQVRAQLDSVLLEKSRNYERQNQFAMALDQLEQMSEAPEKNRLIAEFHGRHGDSATRHKRYNEAREAYQSALERDPLNARYAFDLGATLYMLGRLQQEHDRAAALAKLTEAERFLKQALKIDPANPRVLYKLADVEIARSNTPAAADYLRRLNRDFPDSKEGRAALRDLESMGLKP